MLEIEINPGKSNRARVNRAQLPRARELLGLARTVLFAPDDLALVKGDPSERRAFADDLLVLHVGARYAGTRSDYDRVLKQRNTLLKTARIRGSAAEGALSTLEVWDAKLAALGAEIMASRSHLVEQLNPLLGKAYEAVARGATRDDATLTYKPSFDVTPEPPVVEQASGQPSHRWLRSERQRALEIEERGSRDEPSSNHATSSRPCSTRSPAAAPTSSSAASPWSGRTATTCSPRWVSSRSRATPAMGSPGRSRWRCGWRRTSCCARPATTRC